MPHTRTLNTSRLKAGTIRAAAKLTFHVQVQVEGGIEYMKMDMCGGAAVLGAAEAISQIQPEGVEARLVGNEFARGFDCVTIIPSWLGHLTRCCH
jgi:hypothetical protein